MAAKAEWLPNMRQKRLISNKKSLIWQQKLNGCQICEKKMLISNKKSLIWQQKLNGCQICDKKGLIYLTKNRLFGSHSTDEEINFKVLRSKTLAANKLQITDL